MVKKIRFAALYERLSHDDELAGESNSISHQKQILEEYCLNHGVINYRHFTDDGISGTRFDRPGFLQMMEQVNEGNVSQVIVKDMSRIGRDHLKVGQLMEMFRQKDVPLIAINDGVDTSKGEDDFLPFRNIMNEWYAKDTSKKIKSVVQAKGRSGRHVTSNPPYGYLKSKDDPQQWVIDEEAAVVIRRIYRMTIDGYGPYQIATKLHDEKVDIPAAHEQKLGCGNYRCRKFKDPYNWSSSTINDILERKEYLGQTVNFKTRKHFKDSHSHFVDEENWLVFENTQEPIIDQRTFDLVQKIRANVTRWPDGWGPVHPLTGLVYCADCGHKLYCHRIDNYRVRGKFSCGNYPKKKCASGHRIDAQALTDLVLATLKAVCDYIRTDEEKFVKTIEEAVNSRCGAENVAKKKRLAECQGRQQELEKLLCRIYEDNVLGKLPDARYEILGSRYEMESAGLEQEISTLTAEIEEYKKESSGAKKFAALISKYKDFTELTPEMANELIDRIVVHERDRKGSVYTTQRVDIYFSFIGEFLPPEEEKEAEPDPEKEKEWQEFLKRRERGHRQYMKRKANGKLAAYNERTRDQRKRDRDRLRDELPKRSLTAGEYKAMKKGELEDVVPGDLTQTTVDSVTPRLQVHRADQDLFSQP